MVIQKSKHILDDSKRELLLGQCSSDLPMCVNVADLGCSSGPNAFFAVEGIIKSINENCRRQLNHQPPSVQVFLNDQIGNDFNTLFKMLPNFYDELEKSEGTILNNRSCYYCAAVPGSFYGRLFPDHSIHFLHSSSCLHWLSQVPVGLVSKSGEPLNKKNIWIAETSPPSVHEAHMNQFENDFTTFLRMRSQELVPNGHMVLTFLCKNDEDDGISFLEMFGNTLQDMVSMGRIGEEQLATFNVPLYTPSVEELKQIIKVEGSFTLKRSETFKLETT